MNLSQENCLLDNHRELLTSDEKGIEDGLFGACKNPGFLRVGIFCCTALVRL